MSTGFGATIRKGIIRSLLPACCTWRSNRFRAHASTTFDIARTNRESTCQRWNDPGTALAGGCPRCSTRLVRAFQQRGQINAGEVGDQEDSDHQTNGSATDTGARRPPRDLTRPESDRACSLKLMSAAPWLIPLRICPTYLRGRLQNYRCRWNHESHQPVER